MADTTNERILKALKQIRSRLSRIEDDPGDLKADFRGVKAHVHGFGQTEMAQDGRIASLQRRVERIERRLDLYEPASG